MSVVEQAAYALVQDFLSERVVNCNLQLITPWTAVRASNLGVSPVNEKPKPECSLGVSEQPEDHSHLRPELIEQASPRLLANLGRATRSRTNPSYLTLG